MSDSEDPEFVFSLGALIAQSAQSADHHHMAMEEYYKSIERLLTELSTEHLVTLNHIFILLNRQSDPSHHANYMEGQITAVLRLVRHVCSNCGVDHDTIEDLTEPIPKEDEE